MSENIKYYMRVLVKRRVITQSLLPYMPQIRPLVDTAHFKGFYLFIYLYSLH